MKGESTIRLWGISREGERRMVRGRFHPFLFLIVEPDGRRDDILEQIERNDEVVDVRPVRKKIFGREVWAIKVSCRSSKILGKKARTLSAIEGVKDHLFDDIRPALQYLLDKGIKPSGWINVKVLGGEAGQEELALRVEELEEDVQPPPLRILAFSVTYHSRRGTPDPSGDPVLLISTLNSRGEVERFSGEDLDDSKILREFTDYIQSFDPDIIVGFESNRFHWDYLVGRARGKKMRLGISRVGTGPHRSIYGHVSITGRANIDLYELAGQIGEVEIKTLDHLAEFFNISVGDRIEVEQGDMADCWKTKEGRSKLYRKSEQDAWLIMKILEENLDFLVQLSHLTGLPLDQVLTAAVGFKVESYLLYEAYPLGELPPRRKERPYFTYVGGLVMKPKIGVHENIAVLDFKSMYPSLMASHNISPDTYTTRVEDKSEVYAVDAYAFKKSPPGFYKKVIGKLMDTRSRLKKSYEKVGDEAVKAMLREREKAVKTLTNALYGYAGWPGARWYTREVAEATASLGRKTLRMTLDRARSLDLDIIYGDTDSVFIEYDKDKIESLQKWVSEEARMEIKLEKVFTRIIFTEAKKKYAGITREGALTVVGMEAVRSDWTAVARRAQKEVLNSILEGRPIVEAVKTARAWIGRVRRGDVAKKDLVIWKTLTRPVEKYEVNAPHVVVSKKLVEEGVKLKVGDSIGFIVLKGGGRIYERAEHYSKAKVEEVDYEYYVKNQVTPAVMRVLHLFGVKKEELIDGGVDALDSFL